MNVDISVATPKQMDEGWHLDPQFLKKIKDSGWVQGVDLEEIEEVLLGFLCLNSRTSALVWHVRSDNSVVRFCTRCALQVDHEGKPDPRRYKQEWIRKFVGSFASKCNHMRTVKFDLLPEHQSSALPTTQGINSHTFHYDQLPARTPDPEPDYNGLEVQDNFIGLIRTIFHRTKKVVDKDFGL